MLWSIYFTDTEVFSLKFMLLYIYIHIFGRGAPFQKCIDSYYEIEYLWLSKTLESLKYIIIK